jgi:hypothetical protein
MLTIKSLFLVGAREQFFLISSIYSNTCLARRATVWVYGLRTSCKYGQKMPMNSGRERGWGREREREREERKRYNNHCSNVAICTCTN